MVEWHCLHPRARAEVSVAGSHVFRGFGYVERIVLSLPAWDLPIAGLRWGRFLNDSDALVWIDLRGPFSTQLAYHNGARVRLSHIDDVG